MAMEAGTKLGPYEILSPLGAGGMGEVYLAQDTKLGREVAIKVLPASMTQDAERVARFEREARLLAALNHPNIAAVYGFDDVDGTRFLVMEYVTGATLAAHLKNGPVAVEDALDIARQIAEALEAAHTQGIIHRDLKPANVMIRADGTCKVLDFGLAKALDDEPSSVSSTESPTITADYTRPGVILGTAAYMSPEQARGRPLDKRTDIWSLGTILFECLTGQSLYAGETVQDSLGAILHKDPEWSALPPSTPPTVRLLLRRCLTKDRKRRLHDAADARIELENAIVDPSSTSLGLTEVLLQETGRRTVLPWLLVALLLIAVPLAAWISWRVEPEVDAAKPVVRLTATLADESKLATSRFPLVAISPDGTKLAYTATTDNGSQLFLRSLNEQRSTRLKNTDGANTPVFSPDGQWIAFFQNRTLKKVSVLGGPAIEICPATQLRGADWSRDNLIAFAPTRRSGIWTVRASGGTPKAVTDLGPSPGAASDRWPHFLPDGRTILYTHTDNEDDYSEAKIEAVSLDTGKTKTVVERAVFAEYVPTGYLVYVRDQVLIAAAFDPDSVEIVGPEVPVLGAVTSGVSMGSAQYSFSDDGILCYLGGYAQGNLSELAWVDRTGSVTDAAPIARPTIGFALSPDNRTVALTLGGDTAGPPDIWLLDLARDTLTRLTFFEGWDQYPVWSPDSTWVYFASDRASGTSEIYRRKADGSGDAERLTQSTINETPVSVSPDGSVLVFTQNSVDTGIDAMLLHLDDRSVEKLLVSPFDERYAAISPDGQWIAYESDESGESGASSVYLRPLAAGSGRIRVSPGRGRRPVWSHDGKELFYTDGDGAFYVVPIAVENGGLLPGTAKLMFELPRRAYSRDFNVSRDDKRFLVLRHSDTAQTARLQPTVVINWFTELDEKMAKAGRR